VSAVDGAASLRELGLPAARDLTAGGELAGAVVGVGVDAVDLDRFRRVLERRPHLADRLFTAGELAYARAARDPVPRLSTRFAAKEAAMKALGVGLGAVPFGDVEVARPDLDAPVLVLHRSAGALADRAGVTRWHLSLTHTDRVAMALVVAEGGGAPDPGARPRTDRRDGPATAPAPGHHTDPLPRPPAGR
jgi:holo-[acyl-carrier protein] synthase